MEYIDIHVHVCSEDPYLDRHVKAAEECGVRLLLCHAVPEEPRIGGLGDNRAVLEAVRRHPGVVVGSLCLDLRLPVEKNLDTLRRYADAGFRCVKLFPNLGFDPSDARFDPVWEEMENRRMLCLSHCGYLAPAPDAPRFPFSSLTATPLHYERPARVFPGINFIMAHFGGMPNYLETIMLCTRLENFYADCTPGQGRWIWQMRLPGIESMPFERFLWGTDMVVADDPAGRIRSAIDFWNRLFDEMGIGEKERRLFFHDNSARLLGFEDDR